MKTETYANKLAELLGIKPEVIPDKFKEPDKKKSKVITDIGVNEADIQDFRAAQGLIYFLQAPELFSAKVCKHCGESFLVSRKYVAMCSYTCIEKSLEELGVKWRKGHDLEALANDPEVYAGNEPIWIKNLDRLRAVLDAVATNTTESEHLSPSPAGV